MNAIVKKAFAGAPTLKYCRRIPEFLCATNLNRSFLANKFMKRVSIDPKVIAFIGAIPG